MTELVAPLPPRGHVVIRDALVLSQDDAVGELRGDIEVRDGAIVAVGPALDAPGATPIDGAGTVAIPGFVDTHWHLWGTLLRGAIGDGHEAGWFARKALLAPHLEPADTATGVLLGATEGLLAGITTVHDWAHNVLSRADADADLGALRALGLRARFSYGAPSTSPLMSMEQMRAVMAQVGVSPDEPMDFPEIGRIRDDWAPASDGLIEVGCAVRGPSRSSPEVYREEWRLARELGLPIAMHCAGTRQEVARIRQVEVLDADGLLGPDLLLAHANWVSPDEMARLAAHDIPVSASPMSELRLAMGFPQLSELRAAGVRVSLSLDTTAISASADPFQAMRVALGLELTRAGDATLMSPRDILRIATLEGARSLGLGDRVGSITPGKRADIVLVRLDGLDAAPIVDPAVAVVHSAGPADVDTVLVDGRVLVAAGRPAHVDPAALVADASARLQAVAGRAGFDLGTVWRPAPGAAAQA